MSKLIRHSYFYPSGPVTIEAVLPLSLEEARAVGWQDETCIKDDVISCESILEEWQTRVVTLRHEVSRTIAGWIRTCVPFSVVQFSEHVWVAFKRPELIDKSSCHGNCLLVPFYDALPETASTFPVMVNAEIKEFLDHFRNLCGDIPPTNTLWPATGGLPDLVSGSNWGGARLSTWTGSLPLLHDGCGDVILLRADGAVGRWNHGAVSPHSTRELVTELKTTEFVSLLADILGISSWYDME